MSEVNRLHKIYAAIYKEKEKLDLIHDQLEGRPAVWASKSVNELDKALETLGRLIARLEQDRLEKLTERL